jgi:hypothetical protein
MIIKIARSKETGMLHCLEDAREINGDNLNNIKSEADGLFKNKTMKAGKIISQLLNLHNFKYVRQLEIHLSR